MRFAPLLVVLALVACSGDDGKQHAAGTSTTPTSATSTSGDSSSTTGCDGTSPTPTAADGGPASIVATIGDVRVAVVDHGASVDVVSLFRGCDLDPVSLGGSAVALPIGGTVTHGDGMRCEGDRITVLSATSDDGVTYQAKSTTYRIDGSTLVQTGTDASTIEADQDPDTLRAYYELDC